MYVIYPASQVVGLTINYREINQVRPFPPRNPSEEPEENNPPNQEVVSIEEPLLDTKPPLPHKSNSVTALRRSCSNKTIDNQESTQTRKSESPKNNDQRTKSESPNIEVKKSPSISSQTLKIKIPSDPVLKETLKVPQVRRKSPNKHKKSTEEIPENLIDSPVENREISPLKILSLEENLKNLEVYREKKSIVKRSRSLSVKAVSSGYFNMAGMECALRELTHPALNDSLKAHNAVAFKLVKTVSEFTEALARIYEQHAEEMQLLVSNFRKRNSELRKERPACPSSLFHTWETLLQEVEIDSQAHSDIASILGRQVSRPLLEKSFYRKMQSRKVFSHREAYENLIKQNEEKLGKTRSDYKNCYLSYMSGPTTQGLTNYINTHNEYVLQLHITNGMLSQYHSETLPLLLQELEEVYNDLCATMSDSVLQGAEMISSRAQEQSRRYEGLTSQCRAVQGATDLAHFVRSLTIPPNHPPVRRHFAAPQPPPPQEGPDGQPLPVDPNLQANLPPSLKNEIVIDRLSSMQVKERYEAARKESLDLETQIKTLNDALHTLLRVQQRSVESNLYNKANEIQEDISAKQYELHQALIHLAALRAQKELFGNKIEASDSGRDRKMSASSTGSMKSKWMKAFKNLKTPPASSNGAVHKDSDKKNGKDTLSVLQTDGSAHSFQEYTYKKITPCDVCSQVLRGHTRQGLKCRVCKLNVHVDCQDKAPKCQQKSRLLRRQKSTSEIETRIQEPVVDEETVARPTSLLQNTRQVHYDFDAPKGLQGPSTGPDLSSNATNLTQANIDEMDTAQRRRLFAGFKSLSVFGSRSSAANRSISLPEKGQSTGTRPFGQPLVLGAEDGENGEFATPNYSPQTHHRTKSNKKR